jgi:subtilisin family serine protease
MRSATTCPAGNKIALLLTLCLAGALPLRAAAVTPAVSPGALRLAGPVQPAKQAGEVYIVQLREAGAASYKGGTAGFAATKPAPGRKLDRNAGQVDAYAKHLEQSHDRLLADIGAVSAKIYSFRYALNGFAVRLTAAEVSRLARRPEVARIWPDTEQQVRTNSSAVFLGLLDQDGGLRADLGLRGEDVVIGVVDSGVAPNHPSLLDYEEQIPRACRSRWASASWLGWMLCHSVRRNPPSLQTYEAPANFRGVCQTGEGFTLEHCNHKLVGARYYIDGFLSRNALDPGEFVSPKDADGHGTHIATVVAGNPVTAELFGTRLDDISGIAPRARVAVYKACWLKPGDSRASCATSDLARAIDDAVADGVDIINYSVGSLETDLTAPDDLALLNALDAGVLSVVAAGNDGPDLATIGSPSSAPWVLTVGASTQTGTLFDEAIEITAPPALAGGIEMREASFTRQLIDGAQAEGELALVDDGEDVLGDGGLGSTRDACEALVNGAELDGRIALIERGGCEFELKLARVEEAGAIAALVYNNVAGAPIVMNGTPGSIDIPAVMIGNADGQDLVDALADDATVQALIVKGLFLERPVTGNQIGEFSSRGPGLSESDFLKPDVTAPGVDILGGHTPDVANGLSGEYFQYLSGTSQSTPQAAGLAALLKEANPDWSPGAIKSALMTTAYLDVVREDGESLADPFDFGAGHVDPNFAIDPGLVYDTQFLDHAAYLCGLENSPYSAVDCDELAEAGYPFTPRDLNLPSIGVTELITGDSLTRRVTNVGPPGTYQVAIESPPGLSTVVTPSSLTLGTGESAEYSVTFEGLGAPLDFWQFGRLDWSDGTRNVGSPIAVRPVTLRAPEEITLSGLSGNGVLAVDFGYDGSYVADVHGLHEPGLRQAGIVDDDASNSFSFRFDSGVTAHYFDLEPGELFLRVALFDALTDGDDDLDLYLYYCPALAGCTQVGQSGSFTSEEEIDLVLPAPGFYTVLVHGFETDQVAGGQGAAYELFAWSFGPGDDAGNLRITTPTTVADGDRLDFDYDWGPLDAGTKYLGAISHDTPFDRFYLSIVTVDTL